MPTQLHHVTRLHASQSSSNLRPKFHGQEVRTSQSVYYLTSLFIHWYHVGLSTVPFFQSRGVLILWEREKMTNYLPLIFCVHQREMFLSGNFTTFIFLRISVSEDPRVPGLAAPTLRPSCPVDGPTPFVLDCTFVSSTRLLLVCSLVELD